MEDLPSCSHISTTEWLHQLDSNKMIKEKELHKNAVYCFEKNPGRSPDKTAVVGPLTSHLANHPNKMNKTCWALL